MENNELAVMPTQSMFVSPVIGMEEAKAKFDQVREFTASCLKKGVDYGSFAGVAKPSLLKPGAEKLGTLFGLTPKFKVIDKVMNWTGEGNPENEPFFYFEYKCELFRAGEFVSSCDASCNSWEKKYRYRKSNSVIHCPKCGKEAIIKGKKEYGGGWLCYGKKGGCGAKFADNDPAIMSQVSGGGEVKNFDTAEQVNTFQKMAQKRAYIGAILIACNLSEYFTQDIEDMASFAVAADDPDMAEGEFTPVSQPQRAQAASNGARTYNSAPTQQQPVQSQKKPFDEVEYLTKFQHPEGVIKMSYENAQGYVSQTTGEYYDEMTTEELRGHCIGLWKQLSDQTIDQDIRDGYSMKLSAICAILMHRKSEIVSD